MSFYKKLLKSGKDAIESYQIDSKVKVEEKNLELKIVQKEAEIAECEALITKQKSSSPIDYDKLLDAIDKKELKERQLKQYNALIKELFQTNSPE